MTLAHLIHSKGPHLHLVVTDRSRLDDAARALETSQHGRTVARIVRGAKSRTVVALFDEIAAALQFPFYFGENWNALDECLNDLDWLQADTVVLVIADALQLLTDDRPEEFAVLVDVIGSAAQSPRAFHAVFHAPKDDEAALSHRLLATGAVFDTATLA